jgi:hypothetical protein
MMSHAAYGLTSAGSAARSMAAEFSEPMPVMTQGLIARRCAARAQADVPAASVSTDPAAMIAIGA